MAKAEASKSFLLRLDRATMEMVEAWAAQEFRSVNGQIQWIIADALRRHGRTKGRRIAKSDPEEGE
ncbi:MAG: hypothetical protein HDS11_03755 [Bacteroides sp.]|nr:hypothetical protein [Bacteroidales bacterium]MBD5316767.1 hypothetical protein [Bacteroides sp.]MBD5378239.1 hypothetical protein [Bacteroides sp.]